LAKKKGKLFVFFVDFKAAFDRVDRGKLGEMLRKAGVKERLRRRIMETYREMRNIIRIGEEITEEFWTKDGVRQGCPLSPTLFNIYIMDLESEMEKEQTGGIVIGRKKFWSISYADDIALLAKSEQELKGLMKRFERYIERKGLSISPDKSKVMVFEKSRGRLKKREWRWKEEKVEEVREIRYLGYILQKNGGVEKHVTERIRRATIAMKQTWSIGERLFKENFGRRMKMFQALAGSVALYGAEIWGWGCGERMDRLKRKYMKWILGLDRGTPNYIVMEETKSEELRVEALSRAIKYEEKARQSEKIIVKECLKKMDRRRTRGELSGWEKKRREELAKMEVSEESRKKMREEGETMELVRLMIGDVKKREREERIRKIKESKYNDGYKEIRTEKNPGYLRGRRRKKERILLARFRCGNEMRGRQYWREEEERKCRICGEEDETIEHVLERCVTKRGMRKEDLLNGEGKGLDAIREIERSREAKRKEGESRKERRLEVKTRTQALD